MEQATPTEGGGGALAAEEADKAVVYQSALYGTAEDPGTETGDAAAGFQSSRSFFIIDKSRMVGERDTVEDAKVVYLPEIEFRREVYHSRCSCLVGVADVYRNMTGEFPRCLSMAGCSYACRLLEPNYFMFLLGRPLEPSERVQSTLQHISDIFHFYYHSPEAVMKKSRDDWQTFAANMTFIFSRIREYVFRDPHSISFMFPSFPYHQTGLERKRSRLFLQASHILRTCQQQESIIGGCIMYKTEIICNQLSPLLMEKLQVIGGKGIELNTKSILEDNVAPETVWVLDVYLTHEEAEDVDSARRNLDLHRQAYKGMTPNQNLVESAVTFITRFPVPASSSLPSTSRSSSRRRVGLPNFSSRRSHQRNSAIESSMDIDSDYYNVTEALNSLTTHSKTTDGASSNSTSTKSPERSVPYNPQKPAMTVLPDITQAEKSGSGGGGSGGETERGRGSGMPGRGERRMPKLHGTNENRERDYENTASKSQPPTDGGHIEKLQSKDESPNKTTSVSTQASLSIPIPPKPSIGRTNSSNPDESSSLEDERFATPSPNFSFMPAAAGILSNRVVVERTTGEDEAQPLSLRRLATDSLNMTDETSHSLTPPLPPPFLPPPDDSSNTLEERATAGANIYTTPPPSRRRMAVPVPSRDDLEDSDDFVDSDVLQILMNEARTRREQTREQSNHESTTNRDRNSPPPPIPARNYTLSDVASPPEVPPHGLPPPLVDDGTVGGDSGEFDVVELAVPPQNGSPHEGDRAEGNLPDSPPVMPYASHIYGKVARVQNITPPPPAIPPHHRSPGQRVRVEENCPVSPPVMPYASHIYGKVTRVQNVTPPPPAIPPRTGLSGQGTRVESSPPVAVELEKNITPPPSPPPRTSSTSRQWRTLLETPDYSPRAEHNSVPAPPPPLPPKDKEVPKESADGLDSAQDHLDHERELPERCESSSPHRALTQSQREEAAASEEEEEEEGREEHKFVGLQDLEAERQSARELQEQQDRSREDTTNEALNASEATEESEQNASNVEDLSENQSSLNPPRETPLTRSLQEDDSNSIGSSTKTNTSDEEEGSDGEIMTRIKAATLRSLPRSTSTPYENRTRTNNRELVERSFTGSLSIQTLEREGVTPSLSFTQLNTPDMTIQLSTAEKLRHDTGEGDEGGGGGGDKSQMAVLESNMAKIRQTLGRHIQAPVADPVPPRETWCIYVQRQFNTMLVLVAKAGLHTNHSLLTTLWKRLLPQLFALDQGLETMTDQHPPRPGYNLALYHNTDKFCSVETKKALYKFRHAVRYSHLEYEKNPELCQVTLLNAPKMVSQRVMGREIYYHHQRSSTSDIFNTMSTVTRTARSMAFQHSATEKNQNFL